MRVRKALIGAGLAVGLLAGACSNGETAPEQQESASLEQQGDPVVLNHGPIRRYESCRRAKEAAQAAVEDVYGLGIEGWMATQSEANGYGYVQDDAIRSNLEDFLANVAVRNLGYNLTVTRGMNGYEDLSTTGPYADFLENYDGLSNLAQHMIELANSANDDRLQELADQQTYTVQQLWQASDNGAQFCSAE